ncbi:glycerol-3-phosphate phosphatase-like isoform X2 [Dreissena polymorpha]|uniref:glycerol-3-phosphate phosphatase-like isoform X2 n=1 Tax=Dreissena polymorpha TaxID=45954 RepID=UPI002264D64A|nr:glycerol-3-phosphate phosphatase-like isoform X2 [Dreissena polymorpha]
MSKLTHQVTKSVALDLVKQFDNFLFDCDGVLWHGGKAIPGCPEALQKLKELGKKIFYVTNNSSKTRAQVADKCRNMGFPADLENVVCTAHISALYLKNMNFTGKVYMVGNSSMAAALDELGIRYEGIGPDVVAASEASFDSVAKYQTEWKPNPEVRCVLVGFDPHISYVKMIKAATYASNKNNLFLATNEDPFLPTQDSVVIPGTGSIVATVKIPARREPHIMGKPGTAMFDMLHEVHGLQAEKTIMVGDSLKTDIAMGVNCGIKSMLVLTGVDDLRRVEENQNSDDPHCRQVVPDYYIDSFATLGEYI